MSGWRVVDPDLTPEGYPMSLSKELLFNDQQQLLGAICWFYQEGPYYAWVLGPDGFMQRVGPISTLAAAKEMVEQRVTGGAKA